MKRIWEIVVGLFVAVGIILTIFTAARITRTMLADTYPVLVHINDAGGVKKGTPVELGGLEVGKVSEKPYFKKDYTGLLIPLAIDSDVTIPEGVIVLVDDPGTGSIVKISLTGEKVEKFAAANDILNGFRIDRDEMKQKGLNDTLERFERSMKSLDSTSEALARMLALLEKQSLPEMSGLSPGGPGGGSLASVNRGMAAFEKTNEKLSKTIENLDRLILNAEGGLGRIDNSITGFDKSMFEVTEMANNGDRTFSKIYDLTDQNTETMEDFHLAINEFRGFMGEVEPLLASVRDGNGLFKTLIEDQCFDKDVRNFVDKIEKHGALFYPREKKRLSTVVRTGLSNPMTRRR